MEIKTIIAQAVAQVEQEKQRQISLSKEKVIREKVVPFNNEVDRARNKALEELTNKLNADILALRTAFENEKKMLEEAGEKRKAEFQREAVETEIAIINSNATTAKAGLEKLLTEMGG